MVGFEPARPVASATVYGTIALVPYLRSVVYLEVIKVYSYWMVIIYAKRIALQTSTLVDSSRRHVHTPQFGRASMLSLIISTSLRTTALVPSGGSVICPLRGATAE